MYTFKKLVRSSGIAALHLFAFTFGFEAWACFWLQNSPYDVAAFALGAFSAFVAFVLTVLRLRQLHKEDYEGTNQSSSD
jgi:uncharacterized protein (DUF2062 family)